MTPITTAEIEAGLELAKKATKRPWLALGEPMRNQPHRMNAHIRTTSDEFVASMGLLQNKQVENANFLTTAANHYESLAAEVLALRAANELLNKHLDMVQATNADLRAVVSKLPKTADGVPVTPGMTVWHSPDYKIDAGHLRAYCCCEKCWDSGCQGDSGSGSRRKFDECYSTPAAAEAARTEARNDAE